MRNDGASPKWSCGSEGALTPGTRIGGYEIAERLGAGGMGEVYRARDPKLQRDVAIKILPPAFATDADRLARFQREARLLASLNHPNVGAIYGVEAMPASVAGQLPPPAIVLELIEGESLDQRITTWNMSGNAAQRVRESLLIARQIADALDAAHERGIVHRDLKPANVKITSDGVVKSSTSASGSHRAMTTRPQRPMSPIPRR